MMSLKRQYVQVLMILLRNLTQRPQIVLDFLHKNLTRRLAICRKIFHNRIFGLIPLHRANAQKNTIRSVFFRYSNSFISKTNG